MLTAGLWKNTFSVSDLLTDELLKWCPCECIYIYPNSPYYYDGDDDQNIDDNGFCFERFFWMHEIRVSFIRNECELESSFKEQFTTKQQKKGKSYTIMHVHTVWFLWRCFYYDKNFDLFKTKKSNSCIL